MSKIERFQGDVKAFASNAQGLERTVFGGTTQANDLTSQVTAAFLRGWGIVGPSEHPSLEDFNAAMFAMSQFIAYQHQIGTPEWHTEQEYYTGSVCTHGGVSYQSLIDDNVGNEPPSAQWTPVLTAKSGGEAFQPKNGNLTALAALAGAANKLPYFTGAGAMANTDLTAAGRDLISKADVAAMKTYLGVNSGGRLTNIVVFTSSGTYTPTAGTKKIRVRIVGGGGGGGGAAATPSSGQVAAGHGASAGSYGETGLIDVTSVPSFTVIVGAKGTVSTGATGTAGGASSFGAYIIAPGGDGGVFGASNGASLQMVPDYPHSPSCSGTNVLINIPGEGGRGQSSFNSTAAANHIRGGVGGSSFIGKPGGALATNTAPDPASGYGAGGTAASVTWATGGSPALAGSEGSPGIVIVEEYA